MGRIDINEVTATTLRSVTVSQENIHYTHLIGAVEMRDRPRSIFALSIDQLPESGVTPTSG